MRLWQKEAMIIAFTTRNGATVIVINQMESSSELPQPNAMQFLWLRESVTRGAFCSFRDAFLYENYVSMFMLSSILAKII